MGALAWTERDVAMGEGRATLRGTLTLPNGRAPGPGVLILAGSGSVDRDGNVPGVPNDSLKLLAHGLAEHGVTSLRADKRGLGASRAARPREEELRVQNDVADALAWFEVLHMERRVSKTFLLGHSMGALVATLVAQRTKVAGLVLIAGAGEPAGKVIERQLVGAGAPEPLQEASRRLVAALEAGGAVPDVPPELSPLFHPNVQPYLASWLPFDPAAELSRVYAPVLIVQGTTDLQVSLDDARRLAAARPGAELAVIEGMNHILRQAPQERAANLATYMSPGIPLAPNLMAAIEAFLSRHSAI